MEDETIPQVRICAYPAHWLIGRVNLEDATECTWSTGRTTRQDDIQIFAISSTLGDAPELEFDPRRDSVHSIWKAVTSARKTRSRKWPIEADFTLLVKLQNPVPKKELLKAGLLKRQWPHHWQGKILQTSTEVSKLAEILADRNPRQQKAILGALGQ